MSRSNQREVERETLDWLAFRYVAGELSGDDAAEFEMRLALEQDAREAVAGAVELTNVVAMCAKDPVVVAAFNWRATVAWVSIAAAACFACVYVSLSEQQQDQTALIANQEVEPTAESLELALLWSETRAEVSATVESDELWLGRLGDVTPSAMTLTDELASDDLDAPDWMLVGIRSLEEDDAEMPSDTGADEREES